MRPVIVVFCDKYYRSQTHTQSRETGMTCGILYYITLPDIVLGQRHFMLSQKDPLDGVLITSIPMVYVMYAVGKPCQKKHNSRSAFESHAVFHKNLNHPFIHYQNCRRESIVPLRLFIKKCTMLQHS